MTSPKPVTFGDIKRRQTFTFMGQPYIKVNDHSAKDPYNPENRYKFSAEMLVHPEKKGGSK